MTTTNVTAERPRRAREQHTDPVGRHGRRAARAVHEHVRLRAQRDERVDIPARGGGARRAREQAASARVGSPPIHRVTSRFRRAGGGSRTCHLPRGCDVTFARGGRGRPRARTRRAARLTGSVTAFTHGMGGRNLRPRTRDAPPALRVACHIRARGGRGRTTRRARARIQRATDAREQRRERKRGDEQRDVAELDDGRREVGDCRVDRVDARELVPVRGRARRALQISGFASPAARSVARHDFTGQAKLKRGNYGWRHSLTAQATLKGTIWVASQFDCSGEQ